MPLLHGRAGQLLPRADHNPQASMLAPAAAFKDPQGSCRLAIDQPRKGARRRVDSVFEPAQWKRAVLADPTRNIPRAALDKIDAFVRALRGPRLSPHLP